MERCQGVGGLVPHETEAHVAEGSAGTHQESRQAEKPIHRLRTVVGRGDGGERGHVLPHAQGGNEGTGFQAAFGVGDDIHLGAACLRQNRFQPLLQLGGVPLHASAAVLTAEEHSRAVLFQRLGDAAPIAQALSVAKAKAVHKKKGVTGLTNTVHSVSST